MTVALVGALASAVLLAASFPWSGAKGGRSGPTISWVMTTGDQRNLTTPQPVVSFGGDKQTSSAVLVDEQVRNQPFVGVGAAMTESSAWLLSQLPQESRSLALRALVHPVEGAGVSVIRVPVGASDFALGDYTYDDLPAGESDAALSRFSMARDHEYVIPVLQEAHSINTDLRLLLSAWSPPAWMKDSGSTHGGSLLPEYESAYAVYLARAVQGFTAAGLEVAAMTIVNEPNHSTIDYPSTLMKVDQRIRVATTLRAELDARQLATVGILSHDHNWDDTAAPISALTGAPAGTYLGSGFHCYAGDVSGQSAVVEAVPWAEIWTTECTGGDWSGGFSEDLRWGARHMLVGAFRNHSRAVLWWNIALDVQGGPKNGGCQNCRGVLTVDPPNQSISRNVEYWLLSHIGRHVPRGSVRIASTGGGDGVESVAFLTPANQRVLLLLNDTTAKKTVTVRWNGQSALLAMPGESVVTATW